MSENEKKSTEEKVTSSNFENVLHGNSEKGKGLKYIDVCEKMKKSREQFNSILNPNPIDLRMQEKHSSFYQIKNPEALKAITDAQKKFENTRRVLASMLPDTPPLADRFKIQEYIAKVLSAPKVNNAAITAYQKMGEALKNAALSGSITDYKTNLQNAIEAEEEFSDSSSIEENEKDNVLRNGLHDQMEKAEKIEENEQEKQKEFKELREETCDTVGAIALNDLIEKLTDIKTLLENFLEEFKKIAEQNSKSSNRWAWASCILSIVAITIAVWSEWSDKTGELINTMKKSHPWSEQQISADDAKNVSVAFHAITEALQKNVLLEKETDRLQDDLSKAQGDLAALQKQYDASAANFLHEKQKLYAEISALKKQIEELKAELAKRPVPSPASMQEDKK